LLSRILTEETSEIQKLVVIFKGLIKNQNKVMIENLGREKLKGVLEDIEDKVKTKYYGEGVSEFLENELEEIEE